MADYPEELIRNLVRALLYTQVYGEPNEFGRATIAKFITEYNEFIESHK